MLYLHDEGYDEKFIHAVCMHLMGRGYLVYCPVFMRSFCEKYGTHLDTDPLKNNITGRDYCTEVRLVFRQMESDDVWMFNPALEMRDECVKYLGCDPNISIVQLGRDLGIYLGLKRLFNWKGKIIVRS